LIADNTLTSSLENLTNVDQLFLTGLDKTGIPRRINLSDSHPTLQISESDPVVVPWNQQQNNITENFYQEPPSKNKSERMTDNYYFGGGTEPGDPPPYDDEEEEPEGDPPNNSLEQYVPLNSDNDNNSPIVQFTPPGGGQSVPQYIPETYDFQTSNYSNEDDLLALNIQWSNLPPGDYALAGFINYKIILTSNAPGGDLTGIKFWKDQAKTLELPVNTGFTQVGMNIWPGKCYGTLPGFFMEGTKPGNTRNEFTVTLQANANMHPNVSPLISHTVNVTVLPVIDVTTTMDLPDIVNSTNLVNRYIRTRMRVNVDGLTEYDNKFLPNRNGAFDIDFTQHLLNNKGLIPTNYFAKNVGGQFFKRTIIPGIALNNKYPFLDTLSSTQPLTPKTKVMVAGDPIRTIQEMSDTPYLLIGTLIAPNNYSYNYKEVDYSFELRTEVNWVNSYIGTIFDVPKIIYPLGFLEWKVRFSIANYDEIQPTANIVITIEYHPDNTPTYPYVGTLANAAIQWTGPFN
jgi:hypothetical protein